MLTLTRLKWRRYKSEISFFNKLNRKEVSKAEINSETVKSVKVIAEMSRLEGVVCSIRPRAFEFCPFIMKVTYLLV